VRTKEQRLREGTPELPC